MATNVVNDLRNSIQDTEARIAEAQLHRDNSQHDVERWDAAIEAYKERIAAYEHVVELLTAEPAEILEKTS